MITPHRCPICNTAFATDAPDRHKSVFPFCSDRCRKVDFHRWWDGSYAIVENVDPEIAQFMAEDPNIEVQSDGDA